MFDKTLNSSKPYDPARENFLKDDSCFIKNEALKFPDFDNSNNRKNNLECEMSGKWYSQEIDHSSSPRKKNKEENFEHHNYVNGVNDETIDDSEISKPSQCEDLPLKRKQNKKKAVKTFPVGEEYCHKEALQYDGQESAVAKKKKKRKGIPSVDENKEDDKQCDKFLSWIHTQIKKEIPSADEECIPESDGLTIKNRKKKKKKNISYDDQEYHQEELHHNFVSSTSETRKTSKKQALIVKEEFKEDDEQRHEFLGWTVTQVNKNKEKENDQEHYVDRGGLCEPLILKRNTKRKQRDTSDQCEPGSTCPEGRHLDETSNQKTCLKKKKKQKKLMHLDSEDGIQSEVSDNILLDTLSAVKEDTSHECLPKAVENSPPFGSNIIKRKRKRTLSNKGDEVDPNGSTIDESSMVKKGKSKRRSDLTIHSPTDTVNMDYLLDAAGSSGISWKEKDGGVQDDQKDEEIHDGDAMEEEHRKSVHVEQLPGSPDRSVEKAKQRMEDVILDSQDSDKDVNDKDEKSLSMQKKTPSVISDSQTGDKHRNVSSTSKFSVSFTEPKADLSLNSRTVDTPRSGSKGSKRNIIEDLHELSDRKVSDAQLLEPLVIINSVVEPIERDVGNQDSDSDGSVELPKRHDDVFWGELWDEEQVSRTYVPGQHSTYPKGDVGDNSAPLTPSKSNDNKTLKCEVCFKEFNRLFNYKRHLFTHTPTSERSFTCKICDKQYINKRSFAHHMDTHTKKKFKCKYCDETFFHRSHVTSHTVDAHKKGAVKCDVCDMEFLSKKALNGHLAAHTLKKHACKICSQSFTYRFNLEEHAASHAVKKPHSYECEICPKTYRSRQNLHDHLRSHGEKTLKCTECDKTFYLLRQLENHSVIHEEHRPYACRKCGKTFKRKSDRKSHQWFHDKEKLRERKEPERRTLTPVAEQLISMKTHSKDAKKRVKEVALNNVPVSDDGLVVIERDRCDPEQGAEAKEENGTSSDGEKEEDVADGRREKEEQVFYRCLKCRKVCSGDNESLCARCIRKENYKLSLSQDGEH